MKKNYFFLPFNSGGKTVNIKSKDLSAAAGEQTVTFYFWGGSNSDEQPGWRGLLKITQNNLATKFYVPI